MYIYIYIHIYIYIESMFSVLGALVFYVCRRMKMILQVGVTDSRISFGAFPCFEFSCCLKSDEEIIYLFTLVMWSGKFT